MEEQVVFQNESDQNLAGIIERDAGNNKSPLVVMCHGFSSGKNSKTNRRFNQELIAKGFATFRFDFRGHYESEGRMEDITVSDGIKDLTAAINYLRPLKWVDQDRIGIVATSFGANVALNYVAISKTIRALALKSPVFDYCEVRLRQLGAEGIRKWKSEGYTLVDGDKTTYKFYEDAMTRNMREIATTIAIPAIIVHGSADTNVPLSQSQELSRWLLGPVTFEIIDGADHQYTNPAHFDHMVQRIVDWFAQQL